MGCFAGGFPRPGKAGRSRPLRRRQPVLKPLPDPAWQAWCDGTALPNPGRIGVGVVLVAPDGSRRELAQVAGHGCNNEAELRALAGALDLARAAGARELRIHSDSDFVVSHVAGRQVTEVARLKHLIAEVAALMAGFDGVDVTWLPRHRNSEADRLARQALGLPAKPAAWPGRRQVRQKK